LIDSSIFMAAERGLCDLEAELGKRLGEWFGMAAITASEMLAGVEWPGRPVDKRKASEEFVEGILSIIPVVAFDMSIARAHAKLYAELKAQKVKILEHDLQIAATALALGQPVVTRDDRSFPRIPRLTVERW
jgi:tRNA(fMet)-specific endonuclease VapC